MNSVRVSDEAGEHFFGDEGWTGAFVNHGQRYNHSSYEVIIGVRGWTHTRKITLA